MVSTKRTPQQTPARRTRRAARDRMPSKADEAQTKPQSSIAQDSMTPKRHIQVVPLELETRKKSPTVVNLKPSKESSKSPPSATTDEVEKVIFLCVFWVFLFICLCFARKDFLSKPLTFTN